MRGELEVPLAMVAVCNDGLPILPPAGMPPFIIALFMFIPPILGDEWGPG
jgi:hypothetical protein